MTRDDLFDAAYRLNDCGVPMFDELMSALSTDALEDCIRYIARNWGLEYVVSDDADDSDDDD